MRNTDKSNRQLKNICYIAAAMLIFSVAGCGNNKVVDDEQPQTTEQEQSTEEKSYEQQEEQPSEDVVEGSDRNIDLEAYAEILDSYYYELKSQQT